MIDPKSTVVVLVRRADARRRTIPQPILVGSARDRVASGAGRRPSTRRGNLESISSSEKSSARRGKESARPGVFLADARKNDADNARGRHPLKAPNRPWR